METSVRHGWKILTHDGRSPLQGGPSLLTGPYPVILPCVELNTGSAECAAGWNYVADIPAGWRIAGMWLTGRPSRLVAVEASADAIARGPKRRASGLTLLREASGPEIRAALKEFSRCFGPHARRMADEQAAWRQALDRPQHDPDHVEAHLTVALSARGLAVWSLKQFPNAGAVRDAWAAWAAGAAGAAWDAWADWAAWTAGAAQAAGAAGAAWDAGAAGAAWDAWAAGAAGAAWAAGAAGAAQAAGAARNALTTLYTRLRGWQAGEPDQYTVGIREAYRQGLAIALPVGPETLGWSMEKRDTR